MKCPEWLLQAMQKGDGVKCFVWDYSSKPKEPGIDIIAGFDCDDDAIRPYKGHAVSWRHAEPYVEKVREFEPGELVLVRNEDRQEWCLANFSHIDRDGYFRINIARVNQCIPYKGNEHLLGTSKSFIK